MGIVPQLVFWMLVLSAVYNMLSAIYWIAAEKSKVVYWKNEAIKAILLMALYALLVIGWLLGW